MARGIRAFFYTVRAWGGDRVILALTDSHVPLNNQSLRAVLRARGKRDVLLMHTADLIYYAAKGHFTKFEGIPLPSAMNHELYKREPAEKSGQEILDGLIQKMKRRKKRETV